MTKCFRHTTIFIILFSLFARTLSSSSPPGLVRNLARGSALKCIGDLCGGLPFEVWKSSIVLEHIHANHAGEQPAGDVAVLRRLLRERGVQGLWSGVSARMVEGFFSGAVLLAGKETLRKTLSSSPVVTRRLSPAVIGFVAGAGGGAGQAIVMAPCSLLVSATAANGGSVTAAAKDVWSRHGLRGVYRGAPAVAARQATNWASRQGFTDLLRPRIGISGVGGEILSGCLGGTLSCWNTPFEVARIESQSRVFSKHKGAHSDKHDHSLAASMADIVKKRGVGGLYTGVLPRICQSCYQTVFLVCIPRLLDARVT